MNKYESEERCPHCGHDFSFIYIPAKELKIKCPYCGEMQWPCSLCNNHCDGRCKENLKKKKRR